MKTTHDTSSLGIRLIIVLLVATAWTALPAKGQEKLPSGEELMDKYVEKSGGKEAYGRIKNRKTVATNRRSQAEVRIITHAAEPGNRHEEKQRQRADVIRGVSGDVVWGYRNNVGRIFDGATRQDELIEAFFHMPLKWRELYEKAECKKITKIAGKNCYEVELTHKSGAARIYYLDVDTMLPVMVEKILRGRGDNILTVQLFMDDYRKVDGILYPFRVIKNYSGETNSIMKYESIEHNVDLPANLFELPPQVKELLENK
ncbi:MAG: outer membrane lipoprotein-sorting protein [Planctomycetes bacterium]|nr:outer membrane lipoprotein-sorting protein [Planctomycetota bacterium]